MTNPFTCGAESGTDVTSSFCPKCEVQIDAFSKLATGLPTLKPGTLDGTIWQLPPNSLMWLRSADVDAKRPCGCEAPRAGFSFRTAPESSTEERPIKDTRAWFEAAPQSST
jgi:hypothetical protein